VNPTDALRPPVPLGGPDDAELARLLDLAAQAADSTMLECAAIRVRRLSAEIERLRGRAERLEASCEELLAYVEAEYGYVGEDVGPGETGVPGVIARGRAALAPAEGP
jgi:hypothetical protein